MDFVCKKKKKKAESELWFVKKHQVEQKKNDEL